MRLRSKQPGEAEVSVTSFSDIAFLLIIFFILTTTFIRPAGRKISIPSGAADPEKAKQKQLTINVKQNQILYGEKAESLTMEALREALAKENFPARDPSRRIVILDAAGDVPYEEYYQVVMAITKAGGVLALIDYEEEAKGE